MASCNDLPRPFHNRYFKRTASDRRVSSVDSARMMLHVKQGSVRTVLDLRRTDEPLANAAQRVAFRDRKSVGILISYSFRSSIARPTDTSIYTPSATSR